MIEIWTPDESSQYGIDPAEVSGLRYTKAAGYGDALLSFHLRRDPRIWHEDLALTNVVKVRHQGEVVWSGEITAVSLRASNEASCEVECQGFAYRLESRRTTVNFGNTTKGSAWITTNLIGDADLGFTAGTIATSDYEFPIGIDYTDSITYMDLVDRIQKANDWHFSVRDKVLNFHPKPTTPTLLVKVEETELDMRRAISEVENYLRVDWTDALDATSYFWWPSTGPDATSAALYRRRDGYLNVPGTSTIAQAQQMAAVVLAERRRLTPQTTLRAVEVYSLPEYVPVPLQAVNEGELVIIEGLFLADVGIDDAQALNELTTFHVSLVEYDAAGNSLTLSPGEMGLEAEKVLARAVSR